MFGFGKLLKWSFWLGSGILAYHLFLIKKYQKLPEGFPTESNFLYAARFIDFTFYDIK